MNQIKNSIRYLNKFKLLLLSLSFLGLIGLNSPAYGNNLDSLWEEVNKIDTDSRNFQNKYRQWAKSVQRVIRQIQSVERENKKLEEDIAYIKQHGKERTRHHQRDGSDGR